jgi:16S rRNA processing protein RimM
MSEKQLPGPPAFLNLGQVVMPFGVAGELKVRPETDDPARLRELKEVECLMPNGDRRKLGVETVKVRKDGVVLVKFVGFDTPELAATLRKAWLQIAFSEAKRRPGQVLYADVLGMRAIHADDGHELGIITEVLRAGQDLLEVRTPSGEDVLVPWIDVFVKEINMDARTIRMTPIEGLFTDAGA